jgi:hypothetical protein
MDISPNNGQSEPANPMVLAAVAGLAAPQAAALAAIIQGSSVQEAAQAAGIDRSTLYRWRTSDGAFRQALTAWRIHQRESAHDRLCALSIACTDTVERAVMEGDARLALRVLERIGVASDLAAHPTPPHVPTFAGYVVRLVSFDEEDRDRLIDGIAERSECGRDMAERMVSHKLPTFIAGPFTQPMAEHTAAYLRDCGAVVEVVPVRVSYHECQLPNEKHGEILPLDGAAPHTPGLPPETDRFRH